MRGDLNISAETSRSCANRPLQTAALSFCFWAGSSIAPAAQIGTTAPVTRPISGRFGHFAHSRMMRLAGHAPAVSVWCRRHAGAVWACHCSSVCAGNFLTTVWLDPPTSHGPSPSIRPGAVNTVQPRPGVKSGTGRGRAASSMESANYGKQNLHELHENGGPGGI